MNPTFMTILLATGWGAFAYSAWRRWKLMTIGPGEYRFDRPGERLKAVWTFAIRQLRMHRYPLAGIAHMLIFAGFFVLLLRTLILWGRGFDESFNFWLFGPEQTPGKVYSLVKDIFVVLVILGTLVFLYYRLIAKPRRMTLSTEGLVILGIILAMMIADVLYDGASLALEARAIQRGAVVFTPREFSDEPGHREVISFEEFIGPDGTVVGVFPVSTYRDLSEEEQRLLGPESAPFIFFEPAGSAIAELLFGLDTILLRVLKHAGFWTHSILVLLFLNLLTYSKHFHVITAIPNVYTQSLAPPGRLPPMEDIDGKVERGETLGVARINQFSWKSILDFYTCTECGRCSDHCPATNTGKKLSPKHFALDLRDFLYQHEKALAASQSGDGADGDAAERTKDLVDGVIHPEVLWACTTCRACEVECPVFITFVDKIVDMRRYLVQERGEFPNQLQNAFRTLESAANPWGFPADDRGRWGEDLGVKTLAEHPEATVIFWVGCMPSFDDRSRRITRATAQLLQKAGVDFAILGTEEQCTGDPARRAGNEYLYQMFARQNVETLNNYGADKKKIVTTCPHCFNTLLNEYPDFGGRYEVIHHTTFLAELVRQGKLKPDKRVEKKVAFHDSCYLGRYNEVYDPPRDVLKAIPGLTLLEPKETRDRGMCCGAGGAQMFKEEEPGEQRVNRLRAEQLLATAPDAVSSACPFCMRMLTDGLADKQRDDVPSLDIAEVLLESVGADTAA